MNKIKKVNRVTNEPSNQQSDVKQPITTEDIQKFYQVNSRYNKIKLKRRKDK